MLLLLKSRLASFESLPKPLTSISVICNTKCERILRGNKSREGYVVLTKGECAISNGME